MSKQFSKVAILEDVKEKLIKLKVHPKESMNDVIERLIEQNEFK